MAEDRVQRRLAAIISADVVGYSKMMGQDEAGTLARLKSLRAEFLHPKIAEYGGRVVKTTGDGTLIEFPSAVDAVSHAVDVQRGMAERNAALPEDRRIRMRLGINVGDIIIDGEDIFGDGVNVAARLEALAEPGGICISERVREYIGGRIDVAVDDLGPQTMKNIAAPVHAYRIRLGEGAHAGAGATAAPLPLPNKPSIAVLPFVNMSGDAEQEYFADGMTEDIITALSQMREFFVIARNTTFTYKGRAVDVQAVAAELGVRYVLEGSVRKAGGRVRITAQLIDGATGSHIWADRYDRDLEDIFAVQDEITQSVVGMLGSELSRAEQQRALVRPPESLDAWELFHRGMFHLYKRTKQDNAEARRFFEQAIARDPNFAAPYAGISRTRSVDRVLGLTADDPGETVALARRAIALDDRLTLSHHALGIAHILIYHDGQAALRAFEEGLRANPNDAQIRHGKGMALMALGRAEEGIACLEEAIRLSPADANIGIFYSRLALANLYLKRFDAAVEWGLKAAEKTPVWIERTPLPAALAHLGRDAEAARAVADLRALRPDLSLAVVRDGEPCAWPDYLAILLDGLRKAGVPER